MKKSILVIAVLLFGATTMSAQEAWNFGIKGGVNFANFTGDDFSSDNSRTSFNVGVLAEIPIADRFSIQPEVLYSGQGYEIYENDQSNFLDVDDNVEYQLDYVSVPVLAKIYLVDGLSIQAGPTFNWKVNEEIDYEPTQDGGDIDNPYPGAEDFEFGGAAGLEYKFNNGFFIQGRYTYGFSETFEDLDIHNSVIQAGVGFMF
ncbi:MULTISPECIES: porin family protein [unclassified Zunongwangia]|uniref:porin family protein n=1 Tax=unclassified Zunongwangia TaxID=2632541 RepID=UPI0022DE0544|nr:MULTISPECIES: porin family protein [unclassified Zunongwangia]WBL23585.1 porin family protein [Zunongwangia sp. HRR-M8]WBL24473.1 porin family protein [Zunongwangia sp. HGR-M22]